MTISPFTPLEFCTSEASGTIYPHGAHVTAWAPQGTDNALWLSNKAIFAPDKAIRGGVPICFPWFGASRSAEITQPHGFARTLPWALVDRSESTALFELCSSSITSSSHRSQFPYSFTAHYSVRFGQALELKLSVRNDDTVSFSYEEALHTYLHVGDIRQVSIEGLDGARYTDHTVSPVCESTQEGTILFTGETDRIYESPADIRVNDPALGRTLIVEREHSTAAVIWNPWAEKAARFDDMGDDEWPHMLCVEAANIRENAVTLHPHASHTLTYRLHVE